MYDILVIGAGLHALSFLCALLEAHPMQLDLVDAAKGRVRSPMSERSMRQKLMTRLKTPLNTETLTERIGVVDKHGCWLENWKQQFEVLSIESLRSNASLHPDPVDPEMLFEFARMKGYSMEQGFTEIEGIARGKQFVGPFQLPKTALFNQFCDFLIQSYKLQNLVIKGDVTDLEPMLLEEGLYGCRVKLSDGSCLEAKKVVVAIGHTNLPRIPDWVDLPSCPSGSILHAWELIHAALSEACLHNERVAVVGGGLTAIQLVQLAQRKGCTHVTLLTRRPLSIRQFDSDLAWSGKQRLEKLQKFWTESNYAKRFQMIQQARQGGTITPSAQSELQTSLETGNCTLHEGVEIWDAEWNGSAFQLELSNEETLEVEKIWLATGSAMDVNREPMLTQILQQFPVQSYAGLPILDVHLKWHSELEVYFMGGYASLALGPDGVNLAGARRAAFRLREHFRKSS